MQIVWLDGELRDPDSAGLHWSDHGITVGDGVFETIKVVGAEPFALEPHLDRLERSAEGLGLPLPPRATIETAISEAAQAWGDQTRAHGIDGGSDGGIDGNSGGNTGEGSPGGNAAVGRLRLTVTGGPGPMGSERGATGPSLLVTVGEMTLRRDPTPVVIVPWTRNEAGALAGLKTTSYGENVVALAHARERGASEAIFANTRGELCEGTGTNVFVGIEGRLMTPPLRSGCLDGVTRRLVMEALADAGTPVEEVALPLRALSGAEEAFLTSTGREVQPVSAVDGVALPASHGHLTQAAQQAWDTRYPPPTPF
ncbi:MAG: aminotransferase class IV [Microthrixaceae bacterium]